MTEQTLAEQVAAMHQAANGAADPVMSVFAEEQALLSRQSAPEGDIVVGTGVGTARRIVSINEL